MSACIAVLPKRPASKAKRPRRDYISSLPPEVLAEIFLTAQHLVFEEESSDAEESPRRLSLEYQVEVLVSRVNSHWRNVALSTCVLWRHIIIGPDESVERVRVYLERSGPNTPLHLRLDLRAKIPTLTEILDLVFEELSRWERFTIHSNLETAEFPVVSRLYDTAAPSLKVLGLCIHDIDAENLKWVRRADSEQILTHGCPRLTVLRLRGLSMHFFRPPLSHITTLYLEQTRGLFMGFAGFKHFLTASPALAHLSVHDAIIDEVEDVWPVNSVDCIPLPSLISLRISTPGTLQHIVSDILISISAPRLQSLVLKEVGPMHLDRFLILPGVSSKFSQLRSLTFCDFDYPSADHLAGLCAALPDITDFTKYTSIDSDPLVGGDRWPNLQTVATNLEVDHLELLREAVETRQGTNCPLRVLRIANIDEEDIDEEDEENWEWLKANLTVERFDTVERWPPGSDYDPDDTIFT
ncbi:F-box domain-containing protein [Favolaschia claudopus]|uniref:F-box domain-containing protein n=1 Tax=Favolaschia claudopus TaxID=2862362 RepID=A0AAW0BH56_9AGAR